MLSWTRQRCHGVANLSPLLLFPSFSLPLSHDNTFRLSYTASLLWEASEITSSPERKNHFLCSSLGNRKDQKETRCNNIQSNASILSSTHSITIYLFVRDTLVHTNHTPDPPPPFLVSSQGQCVCSAFSSLLPLLCSALQYFTSSNLEKKKPRAAKFHINLSAYKIHPSIYLSTHLSFHLSIFLLASTSSDPSMKWSTFILLYFAFACITHPHIHTNTYLPQFSGLVLILFLFLLGSWSDNLTLYSHYTHIIISYLSLACLTSAVSSALVVVVVSCAIYVRIEKCVA